MRYLTEKKQGFYWEAEGDPDNAMTAFVNEAGGLSVAISNEEPVDSYNVLFEMTAFLSRADAERLRDYLVSNL